MNDILPPKSASPRAPRSPQAKTARQRLEALGFDPMAELVQTHRTLGREAEIQADVRDNKLVLLRPDGKARAYNQSAHLSALTEQARIGGTLAEYFYKKAHQEQASDRPVIPFSITLNTK